MGKNGENNSYRTFSRADQESVRNMDQIAEITMQKTYSDYWASVQIMTGFGATHAIAYSVFQCQILVIPFDGTISRVSGSIGEITADAWRSW